MTDTQLVALYLDAVRPHLGDVSPSRREQLNLDIQAHIRLTQTQGASAVAVLDQLGPPEDLASAYRQSLIAEPASWTDSPLSFVRDLLRLLTRGGTGIVVFFAALFGYGLGGGLVSTAFLKLLFPGSIGAWQWQGRFVCFGFVGTTPPGAQDILGWHYIPVALIAGAALMAATNFLIRFALQSSSKIRMRLGALSAAV